MPMLRVLAAGACVLALPMLGLSPRASARTQPAPQVPAAADDSSRVLARADGFDQGTAATTMPSPSPAPAAASSAAPTPAPAPAGPTPAPRISAAARAEFEAWQAGKIDLDHYIPEARARFTDTTVKQISSQYLQPLGALTTFTYVRQMVVSGQTLYVFRATCANGSAEELLSWDSAGKIQFIYFRPPQ
jgi:hypothetical protein